MMPKFGKVSSKHCFIFLLYKKNHNVQFMGNIPQTLLIDFMNIYIYIWIYPYI